MLVFSTLALSFAASLVAAVPVKVIEARACAAVEFIFAAGTFESGLGQVGAPLSGNLTQAIPGYVAVPGRSIRRPSSHFSLQPFDLQRSL